MVAIISFFGIIPYIALQIKAVTKSLQIIVNAPINDDMFSSNTGLFFSIVMIAFTIILGARRLDPTERHQGMVATVVIESIIKLSAFLVAGIFITYFIHDGFGDIFTKFHNAKYGGSLYGVHTENVPIMLWFTYLILSMSAIQFLPRQFHISVVENSNPKYIKTAMWVLPLYMFLISIFVFPVAFSGLLSGFSIEEADMFILKLPIYYGQPIIALFVFIGGVSAATGMITISTMTLATMITNNIVLPFTHMKKRSNFIRKYLLQFRWLIIALIIFSGYLYSEFIGKSYMLVNIGITSFAAVFQFVPVIFGGLFWRFGNKRGAQLGLSSGFIVWFYTLLLPAIIRSGWLPYTILNNGLFGFEFLKPEQLFGLNIFDPITHSVLLSLFFNVGFYIGGSLFYEASGEELRLSNLFQFTKKVVSPLVATSKNFSINIKQKKHELEEILGQYLPARKIKSIINESFDKFNPEKQNILNINDLAEIHSKIEKHLAGSVGSAAAHNAIKEGISFTKNESEALAEMYGGILSSLKVSPSELKQRIDYYLERESLLVEQSNELKRNIDELNFEISEREKVETALRISEERYRGIFTTSLDAIFVTSRNGEFVDVNETFLKMSGFTKDELLKLNVKEIYANVNDRQKFQEIIERDSVISNFEVDFKRKDNVLLNCILSSALRISENGEILGYQGIIIDITEQKRFENALIESEEKFSKVFYSSPNALMITEIESGLIIEVNSSFKKIFGYSPEEASKKTTHDLNLWITSEDRKKVIEILNRDNRVKEHSTKARKKSGEIIDIEISMEYIEVKGNKYIFSITRDITERKETEEKLLRWANIFKYAEWGVVVCNSENLKLEMMNPEFPRMLEHSEDELKAKRITDIIAPECRKSFSDLIQIAHKTGHHTFESELIRRDSIKFPAQVDVTAVKDKKNIVQYLVINIQDISERIKMNQQITSALRLKSLATLSAGISHEINQPLNSIKLGLSLLELSQEENRPLPAGDVLEKYGSLLNDVDRISAIIQHMRTLARKEMNAKLQSVNLCKVISKALDLTKTRLVNHGIKLEHFCEGKELFAMAHELQLEQVAINLVTNAMNILDGLTQKEKWITITYDIEDDFVIFRVEDNGTGLGEIASRIFEPFFSGKTDSEGQGLGLSLVHTFVTSWGGKIEAKDSPKVGACFSVWLKKSVNRDEN